MKRRRREEKRPWREEMVKEEEVSGVNSSERRDVKKEKEGDGGERKN